MHPDEVDKFTWRPVGAVPNGHFLAAAGIAIGCTLVGFYAGRLSAKPTLAMNPAPAVVRVSKPMQSYRSGPSVAPERVDKSEEKKNDPDTEPPIVLLNPGTATSNTSATKDLPDQRQSSQEDKRPVKQSVVPLPAPKIAHQYERRKAAQASDDDYRALREYVMGNK